MPIRPNFFVSPILVMPTTSEKNTIGTIIILIKLIKIVPIGAIHQLIKGSAGSPAISPTTTDRTKAIKILIVDDKFTAKVEDKTYETKRRIVSENIAMTPAMIERNLKQIAIGFGSSEDMQQYLDNVTKAEYTTIGQCPDKKVQLEGIQLMSDGYYMGFREYDGMFYFCKIKPDYNKETAVSEPSYIDFTKNHWRTPKYNQFFEDIFNSALCVFDTPETLNAFLRWLRHNRNRI